jgi:hypothetical protein
MRSTIAAAMVAGLVLSAAPAVAQEADPSSVPVEPQRAEAAEFGIAIEFPGDWRVLRPEGTRVSAITTADGEPVMEATALMANGGDGAWCDVDAYLSLDAPLRDHAYAYAAYLQQSESAEAAMIVAEQQLPVGPAFRIEIFDRSTGRMRAMYLFDGPAAEDGTVNRYLFACAARDAGEPFWEAIAESVEVFAPVAGDETGEMAAEASAAPTADAAED